MRIFLIILGYLKWHYSKALISLSIIWGNFLYFIASFFSLKLLIRNFFDPWKKMTDTYPVNFNIKEYATVFITNIIIRLVGIIMRTFLLIVGIIAYLILAVFYPCIIIIWLFLPIIIFIVLGAGIYILLK